MNESELSWIIIIMSLCYYSRIASWPEYVNVYLKNGLAKSRGLFHSKIQKQRLQLMLPPFDLEAEANGRES